MTTQLAEYFKFKCIKGLSVRLEKLPYAFDKNAYKQRLNYEIDTIIKMGYPGYFLVVQDFINWAKSNNILVGDGRGSGAGSLCAFALGITNVDPIKYDLYFERFLNPSRVSMPDFDIDFQKDRRDDVIQYVRNKYGFDKVAQIGTFGTFKAKKAIKDIARTLGFSIAMANNLCKLYPKPVHGKEYKLKEALEKVEELGHLYKSDTNEGTVLRWAEKIENRVASFGIHASGIVISNEPLTSIVPLAKGKNNEVVTQWDMLNIEEVGLIKFDFLGLKTLSQIATTLRFIKDNYGTDIDLINLPLDDQEVYASLRQGDTIGIFQLEASSGIRDLTIKVKPTCIEDLAAINAMYRPGPLGSDQMQIYLRWRAGEGEPTYHHPDLKPILGETGGWIVYQEQVLRIARDMAGYTLAEADLLRRAVGKKKAQEMAEQKTKLLAGFRAKGYSTALGELLWSEIVAFADYGFNKSHAVGYSITSYKTAWLKTHYPIEFMASALTCDSGNQDQMIIYIQECKRMGIPVLPPDVNESGLNFTPKNGAIRFGLSAIKNVGEAADHIIAERIARGPFKDFFDFAERVNLTSVNKKKLESLILAGAFDFTHQNRATLLLACDQVINYRDEVKRYTSKLETYEKKLAAYEQRETDILNSHTNEKGKVLKSLKKPEIPTLPKKPEYIVTNEMPLQDILRHEKELTGSFISGHPLESVKKKLPWNINRLREDEEQPEIVNLVAIISEIELRETASRKRMAFLKLEDLTGTVDAIMFSTHYAKFSDILIENIPLNIVAKVEYADIETEDGSINTIPSLQIQGVSLVNRDLNIVKESSLEVPLEFNAIQILANTVSKVESGNDQIRLKFTTKSDTILSPNILLGTQNERSFKSEFYKQLRK